MLTYRELIDKLQQIDKSFLDKPAYAEVNYTDNVLSVADVTADGTIVMTDHNTEDFYVKY